MKRRISIGVLMVLTLGFVLGISAAYAATETGNISGTVTDAGRPTAPLENIAVDFHDAMNGQIVASTTTNVSGVYDSGQISVGNYRVRFEDRFGVGSPGFFRPEFFGAGGGDDFCLGSPVVVVSSITTIADESMVHSGPVPAVQVPGSISGTVVDSTDSTPLSGIEVSVLDAFDTAFLAGATTDDRGNYSMSPTLFGRGTVRVRFSDPAGIYAPEFLGAGDTDQFCNGDLLNWTAKLITGDADMSRIPLNPAVADALAEAGLDPSTIPSEVVDALTAADQGGVLTVVEAGTTVDQNISLDPDGALVLGEGSTVTGNIEGGANNIVVLGDNTTVEGNIVGVGLSFAGGSNVQINGNVGDDQSNEVLVGQGAQVTFSGNLEAATLVIDENGVVTVDGNLDLTTSLEMGANASLTVAGNLICESGATTIIAPSATITVVGNVSCAVP